jgi:glycosyltransferase involved in cell wall biosynthesis
VLASQNIDVIHADQLTMTQFALPFVKKNGRKPVLIFDAHNAVWTITERMRQSVPFYLKIPLMLETKRIKNYEGRITKEFNKTLAVTEPDRIALAEAVKEYGSDDYPPIAVIPIAVDTHQIQPVKRAESSLNILTMGTLYYPPNADGIRWFLREVFPLVSREIQDARLTIVGKNPPKDLIRASEQSQGKIVVTGYVPDLDPYFMQAALMVIPVRAGGGMRVRILEAFARAMPVVTTTVGLEGIQAEPGLDVLVADSPEGFANSVIGLLGSRDLRTRLSQNGRRLAETRYDWQVVLSRLESVYRQLA